jgi:hypothetical protein
MRAEATVRQHINAWGRLNRGVTVPPGKLSFEDRRYQAGASPSPSSAAVGWARRYSAPSLMASS